MRPSNLKKMRFDGRSPSNIYFPHRLTVYNNCAPLQACSSLHPALLAQMSAARRARGLYVIVLLSRSVGCRAAARQTARRVLSRCLLRAAGAAPGGVLFGPQVARGRAGDGPKVFPRWDAAPVPLSGPLLAICFRAHIRCLPPPRSCYRRLLNR